MLPLTSREGLTRPFLEGLPTSLAYGLRPAPEVLVLEPGGGLEVTTALELGARSVLAVEDNPVLADLFTTTLAPRTGAVYLDPRVDLVVEDPRGHVARTPATFDLVVLPLAENRRPVSVGGYSLSETYSLTAQATDAYLARLAPGGVLAVHRWLQLPPTEELRAAAVVVDALRRTGRDPSTHVVVIRSFSTMLVLAKLEPFTPAEIDRTRAFVRERQFDLVWYPGIRPEEANVANVLRRDATTRRCGRS